MHQLEDINISEYGGRLFLGHSLIIIKWNWGFFPKIYNLIALLQLGKKEYVHYWKIEIEINIDIVICHSQQFVSPNFPFWYF